MDSLYYDGHCPLCRREIDLLTTLSDGALIAVDIHAMNPSMGPNEYDRRLAILHLQTAEGEWLTGLDATVRAWSHTRWGWILRPLRWPMFRTLADRVYASWAARRYARRRGCDSCR